ncbi:MAG: hypothetical protein IKH26_11145 [Bacteroidaceae bacterium]|nr:hypothetical protein [Bacteroidaceae bacterium]
MNRLYFILLLIWMQIPFSASAQEKKGNWNLSVKKTFMEGQHSNGNNTGILNGHEGFAEFQILHVKPASVDTDGSYNNQGGNSTKEQRKLHTLSVEWSQPPQYVKVGEENGITVDFEATLDGVPYAPGLLAKDRYFIAAEGYTISIEVVVMPEIAIGRYIYGFSLMQQMLNESNTPQDLGNAMGRFMDQAGIDEASMDEAIQQAYGYSENKPMWQSDLSDQASGRLVFEDNDWLMNLKLGKDSYMLVVVKSAFISRSLIQENTTYMVSQYYLYKYGGSDVDVTTHAGDRGKWKPREGSGSTGHGEEGGSESEGTELPPWIIPVGVIGTIGAIGGFTLLRNLRKKDENEGVGPVKPDSRPYASPLPPPPLSQQPPPLMQQPPPMSPPLTPQPPPLTPQPPPLSPAVPPLTPPPPIPPQEKKGDRDKKPSTFKMILYRECGDTLMVGDEPTVVGARIEEITVNGEHIDRQDLTAQIEINEGENIKIVKTGRFDNYRAAHVVVTELPKKEPMEGDVWFIFRAPGGALRNRLVFNIEDGEIRFKQDNLTLPARYEKVVRLPFVVVGINDGTAVIKSFITDGHDKETQDYSIKTEWSSKDGCYYAIIKDQVTDPKKDEGIAGNYLGYTIHLEATQKDNPKRIIKGRLPLYRYYMGLVMRMSGDVHCFYEEYEPGRHDPELKVHKSDGKDYAPAQQECYLKLYDYDEKEHKLYVIDPKPISVKWTVKEIVDQGGAQKVLMDLLGNEETQKGLDITLAASGLGSIGTLVSDAHRRVFKDYQLVEKRRFEFQKMLNSLGLQFKAEWLSGGEGNIYYLLRCVKSVLIAPNRFDAEMEITAEHNSKLYTFKRTVHILSQPRRSYDSVEAVKAAPKQDEEIEKGLHEIEGGLIAAGLTREMAPLLYFIRLQLDFYDVDFGYDARNIRAIQNCYRHALQRQKDELHEKVEAMDAVDNIEKYSLDWWLEISYEGHDLLANMNWAERMGFAIASFGFSEMVFNIPYEMRKCIVEGKGNKTALDAFKVGALEAIWVYGVEQIVGGVIGGFKIGARALAKRFGSLGKGVATAVQTASKESLKAGGQVTKEAMKNSMKAMSETTLTSEVCTGLKTWLKKQVTWEAGAGERLIASKVKSWYTSLKQAANGSKYALAEAYAKRQAVENIENLQTMVELCRSNPTRENVLLRNQLALKCHSDKQTMMLLKTPRLLGDDPLLQGISLKPLKKELNEILSKIYGETDELVKKDLAVLGKVPISKIKVLNATGSKADKLKAGLDITFDRDITYFIEVNGKPVYFRQDIVEGLYAKHFRTIVNSYTLSPSTTGFDVSKLSSAAIRNLANKEAKQAAIAAKLYDQTVVEDVFGHVESYGDDLMRMVDPKLHGDSLQNPAKVADAIYHKGVSRFDYADELWRQSESMTGWEKEFLQGRSVSEMMEGCRQLKKVFELLKDRDAQRYIFTKIPPDLKQAMGIIEHLDGVTVKLSLAEAKLAQMGYTFRDLAKEVSELVYKVG